MSEAAGYALDLRPRNLVDLLDATVKLYRRHFKLVLATTAVVAGPLAVLLMGFQLALNRSMMSMVATPPTPGSSPFPFTFGPALAVAAAFVVLFTGASLVGGPLKTGATTLAIAEKYLQRDVTVRDAYSRVLPRFWTLLGGSVLYNLMWSFPVMVAYGVMVAVMVGVMAAVGGRGSGAAAAGVVGVLGGIAAMLAAVAVMAMLWSVFAMWPCAVVVEQRGAVDALGRSRQLAKGYFWHVFGVLILLQILANVVAAAFSVPFAMGAQIGAVGAASSGGAPSTTTVFLQDFAVVISHVINVLLSPILPIAVTLLYYDLRVRKEGFDLQMMADHLGLPPPPLAPSPVYYPAVAPGAPYPEQPPPPWLAPPSAGYAPQTPPDPGVADAPLPPPPIPPGTPPPPPAPPPTSDGPA